MDKTIQSKKEVENNELEIQNISHIISPQSSVPSHLQLTDFDSDIWQRIGNHPIRNPNLRKNSLNKDPESRELIRQLMAAANEREKEILLHNQARVFSQVFANALDSMKSFMNSPLMHISSEKHLNVTNEQSIPESTHKDSLEENNQEIESNKKGIWTNFLVTLITPKYILAIATFVFGSLAGYSQLQIQNLEKAVQSYQEVEKSFQSNNQSLKNQLNNIEKERAISKNENEKLTERLAMLETVKRKKELNAISLKGEVKSLSKLNIELKKELNSTRKKESTIISDLRKRIDTKNNVISNIKVELSSYKSQVKSLLIQKQEAQKTSSEFRSFAESRSKEIDELISLNQTLAVSNQRLKSKNTLFDFAETFIDKMRNQIGMMTNPNEDEIEQYLKEYDSAKKNLTGKN